MTKDQKTGNGKIEEATAERQNGLVVKSMM
jgi:hypothetical protein